MREDEHNKIAIQKEHIEKYEKNWQVVADLFPDTLIDRGVESIISRSRHGKLDDDSKLTKPD